MGMLMRRHWVPALLSSELPEPDCPPVRVSLLGEKLLGFRDTDGRPGVVAEFCPHRGASLFLGRNEEHGIRCSFHGWKFDVGGRCVDLPQRPEYAKKITIKSYPCVEVGDIVWAYMGPPELQPEPPALEWATVPSPNRFVSKRIQECNYLQAMEGGIDTTHASWVHRFELQKDPMHRLAKANDYIRADPNPVFDVKRSEGGLNIFARRNAGDDEYYWRITQWMMPWHTLIPPFGPHPIGAHMWVPIDDESCWAWSINFYPDKPLSHEERAEMEAGKGIHVEYIPGTFRPKANKDNDWLIDRHAQKTNESYSGIEGFSIQDASLQESMGPIVDRENEHLIPTDMAIVEARKFLIEMANRVHGGDAGAVPGTKSAHQRVRAASAVLPRDTDVSKWAAEWLVAETGRPVYSI